MDNQTPPTANSANNPAVVQTPSSPKSFLSTKIILLIVIVLILIVSGGTYLALNSKSKPQACTQEAKICPDGTSVGRTGPNCAFAPCPTKPTPTPDPTANWKTYTNTTLGFSAKYPENWPSPVEEYLNPSRINFVNQDGREVLSVIRDKTNAPAYLAITKLDINESENIAEFNITRVRLTDVEIDGYKAVREKGQSNADRDYSLSIVVKKDQGEFSFGVVEVKKGDFDKEVRIADQILSTFKFTETSQGSVLKIPEYGVQITLSDEIKDAYYINTTASKGYVYLKVHSLDTESQCMKDDSSTASLSRVGKDEINPMTNGKYSDSFKGKVIGNYFYYIDLAQYSCADTTEGKAKLEKVRSAFTNAEITQ